MELKLELSEASKAKEMSFNRTFMELKYSFGVLECVSIPVLIVPLWN